MSASRRVLVVVAAVASCVLAAAPPAGAKGIARVAVCGSDGCVDRTDVALGASSEPHVLLDAGTPVEADAVTPEPFVRVCFGIGDGTTRKVFGTYTVEFLPRSGHQRAEDGTWGLLEGGALRAMRRVVAGVPPLAAAGLGLPATRAAGPARAGTGAAELRVPATATRTPGPAHAGTGPVGAASGGDGPAWPVLSGTGALAVLVAAGAAFAVRRRRADGGPAL